MKTASTTAMTAAVARAAFCGRIGDDHLARQFLSAPLRVLVAVLRAVPLLLRAAVRLGDRIEPGVATYVACRAAYFDDAVRRALAAGVDQVVVLGAGYDSRAWRLGDGRARFFEVDHPATQAHKRRALERLDFEPRVGLVPVDLRTDDLGARLDAAGFDRTRPALLLWEGVTMFLPESAVRATLAQIRALAAPGSRLVADFNYPTRQTLGCRTASALGEPCRFALEPSAMGALAAEHGLRLAELVGPRLLGARYLAPAGFRRRRAVQPSFIVSLEVRA